MASGVSFLALSASLAFAPGLNDAAFAGGATPSGGQFAAGAGAISATSNGLSITQSTSRGIIDWQSFSIGQGNTVNIANGAGATLNRVTGGDVSSIAGSLTSTGSVYVINPAGVIVMPTGQVVTTGSFVASTRDVSNSSFMSGGAQEFTGTSSGTVVNQGSITSTNGDVILVGQSVTNSGQISAPNGTVGLAAGDDVLLQPSSDPEIVINAGTGDATNSGNIAAAQAELAAAGGNVYALATNNGGVIRATGSATKNGHVYLTAGGNVTVTGTVSATNADGSGGTVKAIAGNGSGILSVTGAVNVSALAASAKGGTATLTGNTVNIGSTAIISANGGTDGGTIFIGGDRHGGTDPSVALSATPIPNAQYTTVSAGANIAANGGYVAGTLLGGAGNGGNVVVWSNISTNYAGAISAQGGPSGGNGGFVEVSGEQLAFTGTVNTAASSGVAGTLLLDPDDVTIVSSTDNSGITTNTNESVSGGTFTPTGTGNTAAPAQGGTNSSYILNTTIDTALASNNVVINTGSLTDGNTGSGNVHFGTANGTSGSNAAPLYWTSNSSLTINALGEIDTIGGEPQSGTGTVGTTGSPSQMAAAAGNLIVTTGTGSITLIAGGNGLQSGATAITWGAPIVAGGGTVTLETTAANDEVIISNFTGKINNTYVSSSAPGNIVLIGDNVRLGSGNSFSGSIATTGDVIVEPATSGPMIVGNTSSQGPLNSANTATIDSTSLKLITANTLVLGGPNVTSLKLESVASNGNQGISVPTVSNLELLTGTGSGAGVSQDAVSALTVGPTNVNTGAATGGLSIVTGGTVSMADFQNQFGTLAIQQLTGGPGGAIAVQGNTTISNTGTLNIGTVGEAGTGYVVSGITAPSAAVTLINIGTTTQDTAAAAAISANNLILEGGATGNYTSYLNLNGTTASYGGPFNGSYTLNNLSNAISHIAGSVSSLSLTDSSSLTVAANVSDNLGSLTAGTGNVIASTALSGITGTGAITLVDNGLLTIASGAPIVTPGGDILLEDQTFTNSDGASALSASATGDYWRVYSQDPRNDSDGALDSTSNASFVQYNAPNSYGAPTAATTFTNANSVLSTSSTNAVNNGNAAITGNGFLYTVSPTVSESVTNTFTKVYDRTSNYNGGVGSTALTYSSVSGAINSDTVSLTQPATLSNTNLYQGNVNVGNYPLTLSTVALNTTASATHDANNVTVYGYTVTPTAAYTASITAKPITVSGSRAYDGLTDASSSVLGSIASQEISGDTLTIAGTGSVASPNASATAQALTTSNGLVTGLSLSGAGSSNYAIVSGTLTITQAPLTLTPVAVTTQYNATTLNNTAYSDTLSNYTISGFQNGETATGDGLALSGSMAFTVGGTATAVRNAGTYNQGAGTLALTTTNGNYSLNFTNPAPHNYTITQAPVTVSGSKTYDGSATASYSTFTSPVPVSSATGVLAADSGDVTITTSGSATLGSANAGSYATSNGNATVSNGITLNTLGITLSGTAAGNYYLAAATYTVNQAPAITITALNQSKTYGTTANLGTTAFMTTGLLGGDTIGGVTLTSPGSPASANAGTYNIVPSNETGGTFNPANYAGVNYVNGTLTVTTAPVTFAGGTKVYDGTTNVPAADITSLSPLANGDALGGDLILTGTGSITNASVGSYTGGASTFSVAGLTLGGAAAANYTLSPGTFTVTAKPITISGSKTYDGSTTTSTSTYNSISSQLVNGDNVSLSGTGVNALNSANAGSYSSTGGTLSLANLSLTGSAANNYSLVSGTYTVNQAPAITITASNQSKIYGTTANLGTTAFTTSGLVGGDTIGGVTLTSAGSSATANVGGYNIVPSNETGGTFNPANYAAVNYANGTLTVTPEAIIITAVPTTKTYDGTPSSPGTPVVTSGIIYPGDPGVLTQTYGGPNVGTGLTLTPMGTFTNSTNYTVTYVPVMTGVINPAPLTVTGTRVYDGATDAPGSILITSGEIPGDPTLTVSGTGTLTTDNVGTAPLASLGSLTLVGTGSGNYTISGGTVTITPAQLVLAAVNTTKVYDGTTVSNGTPIVTGLIGSDTISALTQTYNSRNVLGTNGSTLTVSPGYTITDGNGGGNYTVVLNTSPGTITPEAITVIGTPVSKIYDGTPRSPGVPTVIGTIYGPDTGIFTETYGGPNVGTNLTLTPSGTINDGNGGNNYVVTFVPVTGGSISPLPVILFGTRVYDGTTNAAASILTFTNDLDGANLTLSGNGTLIAPTVGLEPISSFTGLALGGSAAGNYTLVGAIGNVQVTPDPPTQIIVPLNQTASGVSEVPSDFTIYDGGILYIKPTQNGIVTGTIATIDGQEYQPDNQLGCTLGPTGACIENGIAPTAGRAPAGAK